MELELTLLSIRRTLSVPHHNLPPPQRFTAVSKWPFLFLLLFFSLFPNLGGGAWQAQNCGACEANTRQYRLPGSSHWVAARPSSLSSCLPSWPHLPPPTTAHPSWPIHPKGSTKNATNLALGLCSYSECLNLLLLLTNTQSQLKILDIQHN